MAEIPHSLALLLAAKMRKFSAKCRYVGTYGIIKGPNLSPMAYLMISNVIGDENKELRVIEITKSAGIELERSVRYFCALHPV